MKLQAQIISSVRYDVNEIMQHILLGIYEEENVETISKNNATIIITKRLTNNEDIQASNHGLQKFLAL